MLVSDKVQELHFVFIQSNICVFYITFAQRCASKNMCFIQILILLLCNENIRTHIVPVLFLSH